MKRWYLRICYVLDSKIRGIIVVVRVYRIEDSIIDIPKLLGFIEVLSGTIH